MLRGLAAILLAAGLLAALGPGLALARAVPSAAPVRAELEAVARTRGAEWVPLTEVPRALQEAIVATEDARFYEHRGIDVLGMARAAWANLRAGRPVQGGSTITQQLAKLYLGRQDRTLERKLLVLALAVKLEHAYSKADILEMYLNSVYFGPYAYGIGSAARVYFQKPVRDLTLAESTLLAGLPQAPSLYDPLHQLDRVKARQAVVLAAMTREGYLTEAEAMQVRRARTALDQ
jgi:penicillin-binding protein 1A